MKIVNLISISIIILITFLSFIIKVEVIYFQVIIILIGLMQLISWKKYNNLKKNFRSELNETKNQIGVLNKTIDELQPDLILEPTSYEIQRAKENEIFRLHINQMVQRILRLQLSITNNFAIETDKLSKNISEFFVINKPSEIISGDFIFTLEHNEKVFVFLGDCPGHGIEGGLQTLYTYASILECLNIKKELAANQIITLVVSKIENLEKESSRKYDDLNLFLTPKIALCIFDFKNRTLEFSSNKQKLYLLRNLKLSEYSGDRAYEKDNKNSFTKFTNYNIDTKKNDCFYLTTDGLPKQIGEKNKKAFTRKRFKEFIIENGSKPLSEQKSLLEKEIEQWYNWKEQLDDMLIVGMKLL